MWTKNRTEIHVKMTEAQARAVMEWIDHLSIVTPVEWKADRAVKEERCRSVGENLRELLTNGK